MRRLALLAAFALAGCTRPSLSNFTLVGPDAAAPGSQLTLKVYVVFDGAPVAGAAVTLQAEGGVFSSGPGVTIEGTPHIARALTDDDGFATIGYQAPPESVSPETLDFVDAYWTDPTGLPRVLRKALQVTPWPAVDGHSFAVECNHWVPESSSNPCSARSDDTTSPRRRYGWLVERGRMVERQRGPEGLEWRPGGAVPTDPLPGEPRWQPGAFTANPRDGIVTVVAYTWGRPDPILDAGHGEPFADTDDDGIWSPGEPYYDADGDGRYTDASAYDETAPRTIWRSFKFIYGSKPAPDVPAEILGRHVFEPTVLEVPWGADGELSMVLLDAFLNPYLGGAHCSDVWLQVGGHPVATGSLPTQSWPYDLDPVTGEIRGWADLTTFETILTVRHYEYGRVDTLVLDCSTGRLVVPVRDGPEIVRG